MKMSQVKKISGKFDFVWNLNMRKCLFFRSGDLKIFLSLQIRFRFFGRENICVMHTVHNPLSVSPSNNDELMTLTSSSL